MKSSLFYTTAGLVFATTQVVTSYTFDPLNNIWKPSHGAGANQARKSSSASSYAPQPSELETPVFEEEVIRAQYSTWAGKYHEESKEDGTFRQKSLVQIEYNKKTGEISLLDQDGIVTKEDYQHMMRAITSGNDVNPKSSSGLDVIPQDVTLGTTHLYDGGDEIDSNDVIDTQGEEIPTMKEQIHPQQQERQPQPEQQQQVATETTQSFNTYTIPQPPAEIQNHLQQQQVQQLHHVQRQQIQKLQPTQMHQMAYQQQAVSAVAEAPDSDIDTTPQSGGWGFGNRRQTFIK